MTLPVPLRYDYRFPLRVNSGLAQAERAGYAEHVAQMIRQVLLTAPGERVCIPDLGAGLRRLVMAPNSAALRTTAALLVRQGLTKYLGTHITLGDVSVEPSLVHGDGTVEIRVGYRLIDSQTEQTLVLRGP
jgi:uncharacterized protein